MVSLAYLAFSVVACVLGFGLGLFLYAMRSKWRLAHSAEDPEKFDIAKLAATQKPWETLDEWQRDSNRSLAMHLGACGALPLMASLAAWSSRSEVVSSVCHGLSVVALNSPLCG